MDVIIRGIYSLAHHGCAAGDDISQIVCDWVCYLKEELLWGNDDTLFPKSTVIAGEDRGFKTSGVKREHWSTASPIRTIFKDAFQAADLPYFIS